MQYLPAHLQMLQPPAADHQSVRQWLKALQERPDLSEMKANLMVNNAKMKAELSLLEDTILQMLSASQGNILDDENLITTLAVSKV